MEVGFSLESQFLSRTSIPQTTRTPPRRALAASSARFPRSSLNIITSFTTAPLVGGSLSGDFAGQKFRPPSLRHPSPGHRGKRGVVTMVIPFLRGNAWEQPPPDLASYLYKNRIVYLGMSLVPSVTELILAEFLYLQYEDEEKPIYLYMNSTGTIYVKPPIFTLCVGNAWGEAALLLAAGAQGNRAALPSSTIMIKEPIARFQGQATDVELARKEIKNVKSELVSLYSRHIGKSEEQIAEDIRRPKYFSPKEAFEYGIIDKVLYNERGREDRSVVSDLKRAQLI